MRASSTITPRARGKAPPAPPRNGEGEAGSIRARMRERILKAAEAVFAKKGFDGATTGEISRLAGLPKANLHYYFRTKEDLYHAVLQNIIDLWLGALDELTPDAEPADAIGAYIRKKMAYSRDWPDSSRIFALEVITGGKRITSFLKRELPGIVAEKVKVLEAWAKAGKIDPVDPAQFLSLIWATTQHYADFAPQIAALHGKPRIDGRIIAAATRNLTAIILKGAGVRR
jgi:TetR/AcrR family transcriptional regulator